MTAVSATTTPRSEASPEEPVELAAELRVPARDLGALGGEVGVVQLFDLLGDRQHRLAPRQHLAAQEAALWLIFSTSVQSNSGSKACQ